MRLSKRHLLLGAAATAGGLAGRIAGPAWAAEGPPPAAPAAVTLTATRTRVRLPGAAGESDLVSFDSTPDGPALRHPKGAALDLAVKNALDVPLALQWHGLRLPNAVNGEWPLAGEPPIPPGATRAIRFVPPDSGLSWFHAAALPGQPDLTAQGLRGTLVVEENDAPAVDRDVLLSIADWPPDTPGAPAPLTVNGAPLPARATVPTGGRLRLRVLNASTTRPMLLSLDGARPLIIAIDGQPSDLFEPVRDQVPVGPGARFEFMIDLPRDPGAVLRVRLKGGGDDRVLFEALTEGPAREAQPPIVALPRNPLLSPAIPLEKSVRADLRIEAAAEEGGGKPVRWRVNGRASPDLPVAPLLTVAQCGVVTLGIDNRSGALVPLRLHGHVMRLLHAKDDGWEPYWRDGVILLPGTVTHVAFVADNPGKWLIGSALFEQAAFGLQSWFKVG